jgi:hypothetical protein
LHLAAGRSRELTHGHGRDEKKTEDDAKKRFHDLNSSIDLVRLNVKAAMGPV